jgi:hypothetical protein
MPRIIYDWRWEEAFDRFGFDDGDGYCLTQDVANVLENAGCRCCTAQFGAHNTIIHRVILPDGSPLDNPFAKFSARLWLPAHLVAMLDNAFPLRALHDHRRAPAACPSTAKDEP